MTSTKTLPNKTLIEETTELLKLSSMEQDKRTMWTVLLPKLETKEIEKQKNTLVKEVQAMTDIYLRTKKQIHKNYNHAILDLKFLLTNERSQYKI